jgi:phage terminase large subunit-like protein
MAELDETTAWARAVVAGDVVAGELVRAACQRHLTDIEEGEARGLFWRPAEAQNIINAYPTYFQITDGPMAGEPFVLLPWMKFLIGSLFGWWRVTPEGQERWRFDEVWLETGKGAGKSPLMAATALLVIGGLGRRRALAIVTGPKEETAKVTMADAAAFVRSTIPGEDDGVTLESQGKYLVRGEGDNAHKIEHVASNSVLKTVSGKATQVSGPRPTAVFQDELHEVTDANLVDIWMKALAKNPLGGFLFMATNTPGIDQPVGSMFSERARRVVLGHEHLDSLLVFIARVDVADQKTVFDTEAVWGKAMPSLNVTFPVDNVRQQVAKARGSPMLAASVKRLYFGIPGGGADFWLDDPTLWERALAPVDEADYVNCRCWLSLDLADRHDLLPLTMTWEVPTPIADNPAAVRLVQKTWYWTRGDGLAERSRIDGMAYEQWAAAGYLNVVPGPMISKDFPAVQVQDLIGRHNVQFMAVDMAKMREFQEAAKEIGLDCWYYEGADGRPGKGLMMVKHAQGLQVRFTDKQMSMPTSLVAFEDHIRAGTITIDNNPMNTVCAANAKQISDAVGNRAWTKKATDQRGRIDGMITMTMGAGAAGFEVTRKESVYAKRGAIVL